MIPLGFSNQSKRFQKNFSSRSFRVNIKTKYSNTVKFDCGVPQGSIFGPLSFLLICELFDTGCRL